MKYSSNVEKNPRVQDIDDRWNAIYAMLQMGDYHAAKDELLALSDTDDGLFNAVYWRVNGWLIGYAGRPAMTKEENERGFERGEVGAVRFSRLVRNAGLEIWRPGDLPMIMKKAIQ